MKLYYKLQITINILRYKNIMFKFIVCYIFHIVGIIFRKIFCHDYFTLEKYCMYLSVYIR